MSHDPRSGVAMRRHLPASRLQYVLTATGMLLALLLMFVAADLQAYSGGITGRTKKSGSNLGCGSCHSPSQTLTVSISGPAELAAGATGNYTINISDGAASSKMGVDIAASSGAGANALSEAVSYLQKDGDELTHNDTDRDTDGNGAGTFAFKFTMPAGASVGTAYTIYAAARVSGKWDNASNFSVQVPKFAQTINFGSQASPRTYSINATFPLSPTASASSGLAISYSTADTSICTISGTTVTMKGAGPCTIRANQGGNGTYDPAPQVSRTVTINPGNQSITFQAQTVTPSFSNGGTFNLQPPASASSGLAIQYSSITTGVCTKAASGIVVNMIAQGQCTIVASQPGDADWNAASSVQRSITISKGSQTITFPAQTNKTFIANGTFTVASVTASSGLPVTYVSLTPEICTMPGTTSNTVTMVDNGTCKIEASQSGNSNFFPANDVTGDILITETPNSPIFGQNYSGDARTTITFGRNGNGPNTSYVATCTASGQTTRTGSSTTSFSPIVVTSLVNGVVYTCTLKATNSFGESPSISGGTATPLATPLAAPVFRSSDTLPAALYTFNVGTAKTFIIVATARPNAVITNASSLPAGMTFQTNATNSRIPLGVAWLGGTPAAGTVGSYNINLTASNSQCGGALEPVCTAQALDFTIAKGSPTITFPAVPDQPYSPVASYNLAATIATPNSTLSTSNIVFTSATTSVCTVSGTLLTTVGTGTCTINANSPSAIASPSYAASYNAAPQVSRSFTINKGNQTITFGAQASRTYSPGGTFALSPAASASSGLAVSYASLTPSDCTIAGTTVTIVSAGSCQIEASQDGNSLYFAAADVIQTIAINPAAQTITFPAQGSQSFVQGGSFAINPLATTTSGLTVDYASTTPGVCIAAGASVMIVSVGTCTISATQAGDQNYSAATAVNRSLSINAVPPGAPVLNETFGSDATIRLFFDPPSNTGGGAITSYRGTCNPGNIKINSANSPVVMTGLANNTLYTCTVAAQNAAGTGSESNSLQETPVLRSGAVLWTTACSGCHGATPNAGRLNAAGGSGAVIDYVRSVQPEMLANNAVQALTANELAEIAKYIRDQLTPITANTAYVTPVDIDVGLPKHLYLGGVAFEAAQVVTQPANGTLSVFNGTVITYTPNLGFTGSDSFTYRGRRSSPTLLGDAFTVTINVAIPAAPVITSSNTANGTFGVPINYQITATNSPSSYGASGLGAGVAVNTLTGLISGTPSAAGVFNVTVSATNPGGTGMQAVQVTISKANQSITFGAQPSPRPFGSNFVINPAASATSGLTVAYSSLTTDVCTVVGTTVTPVSAGVCTIAANQPGDSNYNAALQVTQNVTIGAILPGAPTGLMAVAGDGQFSLSFSAPANNGGSSITQYNASCTPSASGSNSVSPVVVSVGGPGSPNNGVQFTCSVTATNAAGTGPASASVMVTPQNTPVAPSFTSAAATSFTVLSAGNFNVTASGVPLPTMSLFSGTLPSGVSFNASPSTGTGLLSGTPATGTAGSYPLTFRASNASGTPNQSFTLTIAKANQTINFANPGTKSFSFVSFAISATATSGLTVTFTSNTPGVCTVSGNNVTTVATGVCSISADQAGNADYNAAPQVTQGFSVTAGTQSITFGAQTSPRSFSTTPFALSPVAFSTSGLSIVYSTTTPSVCVMSGGNVATITAGVCTIAANQPGNANYAAATQVTQSVTVNAIVSAAPTIGTATGSDQQATINFTPPASNGGATLSYTATCTASGQTTRTGTGSASPIVVGSMVNGIAYSCSVTATNSAGTSAASGTVMVTPTSADGAALWGSVCAACHAATPSGNQLNGAGSTATVLNHVRSLQPVMQFNSNVQALNASELASIAAFINNNLVPNEVTTAQNVPVQIDVSGHITFTGQSWSAFTSVEVVTQPANGMVSAFTGRTATYTPNPGFSGTDTFTYRGKRTSPNVDGDPVQVTVNVSAGAPTITSAGTANGSFGAAFSYQITATGTPTSFGASGLPSGLSVDNVTGLISGTAGAGGTFNATISATNAGGTGMAPLTIMIAPASQTITFNAQSPSSQAFVTSGTFPINPLASGGASGNPVIYSSTTTSVCTVSGTTVTMVFGGTCTIAANQAGNSNYAAASQVTRSVTINPVAPGAPAIGTATPGNAQAQIGFSAPASNGGSAITQYNVNCTPSGAASGAASPVTVTALTNGVTYTCSVTATNAAMLTGPASSTVQVTPAAITVPGAPIIGVPVEGDTSVSLAFSPPLNNGGASISNYTATCTATGQTTRTGSGATSPIAVNSLVNGVTYDCSITATNSAGTGPASGVVQVTPESAIALTAVQSRKTHGGAGTFDVALDTVPAIDGAVTVEPRAIGAGHQIVFQFDRAVTASGTVDVVNTASAPVGSASLMMSGNDVIVTITGIPDNSRATITLTGVNGVLNTSVSAGFLIGDVNNSRAVNATDISGVKARSGQTTDASNFKFDLNASGGINATDIAAVKARSGLVLP